MSVAVPALMIWLGLKTRGGRRWARITITVILTFVLLSLLSSLVAPSHERTLLDTLIELVQLVVRVAVLMLLWLPEDSRAHFRGRNPAS
ncbi:MAG: hypothetical protein QOC63_752 [Mycobacterium sp.]|jgi:hypothetical protein|nr:hypothetical protein [Mycobacterium sp.]